MSSSLFLMLAAGISTLFTMALPAIVYGVVYYRREKSPSVVQFLGLRKVDPWMNIPSHRLLFLLVIFTLVAFLLVQGMGYLSEKVVPHLPFTLDELAEKAMMRDEARMKHLFADRGVGHSLARVAALAAIPAFSEELFMRGALQPILIKLSGSHHIGILLTALLFALLHLSVLNFLGIFVYALYFGYLAYYLRSIYPGIILHFLNNFVTLALFSATQMA